MKSRIKREDFYLKEMSKIKPNPNSKDYVYISRFEDKNNLSLTIYFAKENGLEDLNASLSWKEANTKKIFKTNEKEKIKSKIINILESECYMFNKILGKQNKIKSINIKEKPNALGEKFAVFKTEDSSNSWNIEADWVIYKLIDFKYINDELSEYQLDGLFNFLSKKKVDIFNLVSKSEKNLERLNETLNSFDNEEEISSSLEFFFSR